MDILLYLSILITLSYLGGLYVFGKVGRLKFFTGGVEFILFGAIIGRQISPDIVSNLFPFLHIELAWIGLLYGIQLEIPQLKRHHPVEWIVMLSESVITLGVVFIATLAIVPLLVNVQSFELIAIGLVLASALSISAPWPLGVLHEVYKIRTNIVRRLRFISGMDDIPGLIIFCTLFFSLPATDSPMDSCDFQV